MLTGQLMAICSSVRAWFQQSTSVRDAAELEKVLGELLTDGVRREQLGRNALKVVHENLGAMDRTAAMIIKHLAGGKLYVAPGV